jgi:hypothetical protein
VNSFSGLGKWYDRAIKRYRRDSPAVGLGIPNNHPK